MGVFRFTSEFNGSQQAVNVWHFMTAGAPSTTDADQAIDAVDAFFTSLTAFMAPGSWVHGSRVTTVDETPNRVVPATSEATTTTGTSNAARQVAAGITWNTAFIGRSYTGRTYVGPLSNGAINTDGLTITTGFATALTSAAAALYAPTASGAALCVWSEKLQAGSDVVGAVIRSGLRTQRRRLT